MVLEPISVELTYGLERIALLEREVTEVRPQTFIPGCRQAGEAPVLCLQRLSVH